MFYKSALLLRDFLRYASAGTSYGPVFDCVCVCLSVCHNRSSIETAEWIELVFGTGAAFHLSYSVLKWNSGIFKNNGTLPGTLSKTPDLKNFLPHIDRRNVLSTLIGEVDAQSVISWTVVGQLSWQYLCELRRSTAVVYHWWSSNSVYSTIPSRG